MNEKRRIPKGAAFFVWPAFEIAMRSDEINSAIKPSQTHNRLGPLQAGHQQHSPGLARLKRAMTISSMALTDRPSL